MAIAENQVRQALIDNRHARDYLNSQHEALVAALGYDIELVQLLLDRWTVYGDLGIQVRTVASNNWRTVTNVRWLDDFESLVSFELDPDEPGAKHWNISKNRLVDVRRTT